MAALRLLLFGREVFLVTCSKRTPRRRFMIELKSAKLVWHNFSKFLAVWMENCRWSKYCYSLYNWSWARIKPIITGLCRTHQSHLFSILQCYLVYSCLMPSHTGPFWRSFTPVAILLIDVIYFFANLILMALINFRFRFSLSGFLWMPLPRFIFLLTL